MASKSRLGSGERATIETENRDDSASRTEKRWTDSGSPQARES
jgi:hypothetical protein